MLYYYYIRYIWGDTMRIGNLSINRRQYSPVSGVCMNDFFFLFAKSPAVFRIGSEELRFPNKAIIIYQNGSPQFYGSDSSEPLLFDSVSFRMNSSEQQYFAGLNIPLNKPMTLPEYFVIRNILACMHSEAVRCGKRSNDFAEHALHLIFIDISEQIKHIKPAESPDIPHYRELCALRERIFSDPVNRWNIDEICSDMNISRTYFHRIYFSAFGVTCMQDVIDSRLAFAGDLLVNTDFSVSRIAEMCGYDSDSYFMRQFKKHLGCTPSEYRRKNPCENTGVLHENRGSLV